MRNIACAGLAIVAMLTVPSFARAQAQEDAEGQPVRPSVQVGVPQGAATQGPARPAAPKPPAKPTPRWPDGKPVMGATPGEKMGTWGSCCGNLAMAAVGGIGSVPFQPWAKGVFADRRE